MKNSLTSAARFALAAILCAFSGLTASAQNVAASGAFTAATLNDITVTTPNCVAVGTAVSTPITLTYTFPANVLLSDVSWGVAGGTGDFTLVSGYAQGTTGTPTPSAINPTGSVFQVRPTGKGKMRVTLTYTVDGPCVPRTFFCGGVQSIGVLVPSRKVVTRSFDFYKMFTSTVAEITGPICLGPTNSTIIYAVGSRAVSTNAQIQAGIGIDSYVWTVTGLPTGFTWVQDSGDGATITIKATTGNAVIPACNLGISVKIGRCNAFTAALPVVVAGDLFAANSITGFPTCRVINALGTSAPITLATRANVAYTLATTGGLTVTMNTIPASLTDGTASFTLNNITGTNTGSLVVTGTGNGSTCFGTQTTVVTMNRTLNVHKLTPGCVAPNSVAGAPVPITFTNAPVGQNVTYTLSPASLTAGWSFAPGNTASVINATGMLSVNTGGADGTLTATTTAAGCTNTIITLPVKVLDGMNCSWTVEPAPGGGGSYRVIGSTLACFPSRTQNDPDLRPYDANVTYSFTINVPTYVDPFGTTVLAHTEPYPNRFGNFFDNGLGYPYPTVATNGGNGTTYNVTVYSPATCLSGGSATYFRSVPGGGSSQPSQPDRSPAAQRAVKAYEQIAAFPNPADGKVQIDLARAVLGDARLTLLDATGREALQQTSSSASVTLDTRALPVGLYTLRVRLASGNVFTQQVAISH